MDCRQRVPVTEQDKEKSYYKYYLEDIAPAPHENYQKALAGPIDSAKALSIHDRNRLFEPGYIGEEIGYCAMPDGTAYIANLVKMPGVTGEMVDWWFAWHGLDNLRYTIWDSEDHYRAESMQKEKGREQLLPYRERYWDTTHVIYEDVGAGPQEFMINFRNPGDMGFDVSKIGTRDCATIVCGNGHGMDGSAGSVMVHFIRDIDGGVELRTRFWIGYTIRKGKAVKTFPDHVRLPDIAGKALCLHNIKEFHNLAALLPRIYPEERDNF